MGTKNIWQMIPRSVVLRNALFIMLVATFSTVLALTLQFRLMMSFATAELRTAIGTQMTVLIDEYGEAGAEHLADHLKSVRKYQDFEQFVYVLVDAKGHILGGNLNAWPMGIKTAGWSKLTVPVGETGKTRPRSILVQSVKLDEGERLLIGQTSDQLERLRQRYFMDMIWVLLVTAISSLVLGIFTSRRIFGFITNIQDTAKRFHNGDLSARVPISGRGDEFDQLGQLINSATDLSERKSNTLKAASDSLAHDLKTPLTRMRIRTELAMRDDTSATENAGPLSRNIGDIDSLLSQINAMLQITHAESTVEAQFRSLDIDAIIRDICTTFKPMAEERQIMLSCDLMPSTIAGVKPLITQALANLIENATKYAPSGGEITVQTRQLLKNLHIIVSDSGPGIHPVDRAKAMERFVRLDNSRTTAGSGLGLHYVSTVARVHHGSLELGDNEPGLRATLILPLYEAP